MGNAALSSCYSSDTASSIKTDSINETHFTRNEVESIKNDFRAIAKKRNAIDKSEFKKVIQKYVQKWIEGGLFLERMFDAFDANCDGTIDVEEFVNGLSIFVKGTREEKLDLSFKLFDLNGDGLVTQEEMARFLGQMYSAFRTNEHTEQINEISKRLCEDLDVNGDGKLSYEEYKLSALKEPLIVDFLDQILKEQTSSSS